MTPSPKKWSCPPKIFSPLSPKILFFSKKLLSDKIFETSFLIKRFIFILVARRLLSFKRDLGPRNGFLAFSQKITHFWKKLVNNKIFNTSFVIKKLSSHSDTVGRVANKVRVEGPSTLTSTVQNISLLTHFLRQKFFCWCRIVPVRACCSKVFNYKHGSFFDRLQDAMLELEARRRIGWHWRR